VRQDIVLGYFSYMRTEFLQQALKVVPQPEVLVNMVSKRVRQLGRGFRPLVPVDPRWSFMEVALREIGEQKLSCELITLDHEAAAKTAKSGKSRKQRPARSAAGAAAAAILGL